MTDNLKIGMDLSRGVFDAVTSNIEQIMKKRVESKGVLDIVYGVDKIAEDEIRDFFQDLWNNEVWHAFFTENQGLVMPPEKAEYFWLIDPVDGSRPIMAGKEDGMFSAAGFSLKDKKINDLNLGDAEIGILQTLKEDILVVGVRNKAAYYIKDEKKFEMKPSKITNPKEAFLSFENYGQPEVGDLLCSVINNLIKEIDASFLIPSATYCIWKTMNQGWEGYVDIRKRIFEEFPDLGKVDKSVRTYDIAAAYCICREINIPFTDSRGDSLEQLRLLDSEGKPNHTHLIVANNPKMHEFFVQKINQGFENYKS